MVDPISDLVARIKNGYLAKLPEISMPYSRLKEAVAKALAKAGYAGEVKPGESEMGKTLVVKLKYDGKDIPALTDIRRVSKPGLRIYTSAKNMPRVLGGLGLNILSTPKGVIDSREAKKLNVGGEIIAQVW